MLYKNSRVIDYLRKRADVKNKEIPANAIDVRKARKGDSQCKLIITEGESGKFFAMSDLPGLYNPDYYGIFTICDMQTVIFSYEEYIDVEYVRYAHDYIQQFLIY